MKVSPEIEEVLRRHRKPQTSATDQVRGNGHDDEPPGVDAVMHDHPSNTPTPAELK